MILSKFKLILIGENVAFNTTTTTTAKHKAKQRKITQSRKTTKTNFRKA